MLKVVDIINKQLLQTGKKESFGGTDGIVYAL
jgi:hypothetical protein